MVLANEVRSEGCMQLQGQILSKGKFLNFPSFLSTCVWARIHRYKADEPVPSMQMRPWGITELQDRTRLTEPLDDLIKQRYFYALNHRPTLDSREREIIISFKLWYLGLSSLQQVSLHCNLKRYPRERCSQLRKWKWSHCTSRRGLVTWGSTCYWTNKEESSSDMHLLGWLIQLKGK